MAFCSKCGSELKEGMKFCSKCGMPVKPAANAESKAAEPAADGAAMAAAAGAAAAGAAAVGAGAAKAAEVNNTAAAGTASQSQYPYRNNYQEPQALGIQKALKSFGGSVPFLLYIIVSAAFIVMSIISGGGQTIIGIVIGLIPSILCLIGMILGFADARGSEIPTGKGIGLYKAGKIVSIVYAVIIGVLCILVLIFGAIVAGGAGDSLKEALSSASGSTGVDLGEFFNQFSSEQGVATVVVIILIVIIAAVVMLEILYDLSLMNSANAIRRSLHRGRGAGHVGIYPVVIMIIAAIGSALNLVTIFATGNAASGSLDEISSAAGIELETLTDMLNNLGTALLIITILMLVKSILGAVLLLRLRKEIYNA